MNAVMAFTRAPSRVSTPQFFPLGSVVPSERDERATNAEKEEMGVTDDEPAFAVPPPDPELKRLEPLLGTWKAEDHTLDGVFGPGVPVRSEETFRWLDGGYFLVQDYETTFGDAPTQKGVNYWFYDSEAGMFRIIFFSNNGPFSEAGNRYSGRAADGRLTFEGPARFQYELDDDGRIRINPDGTISISWWLRDEVGDWQPWMTNTFHQSG
jgi:hypothetical protein